jgi:hypothetical protein
VDFDPADRVIEARGAVIGQSRVTDIDLFVYVVPSAYGALAVRDRHDIARLLGTINRTFKTASPPSVMLLGPGRWGTSTPSLGIPVAFADINRSLVVCEIVTMREGLVPDVSLGTHFLNELVEMDMLYLAIFPSQSGNFLDTDRLEAAPNTLLEIAPQAEKWQHVVRVIRAGDLAGTPGTRVSFMADTLTQKVLCYLAPDASRR